MAGATAVVTLVVTLRVLLPTVATLARASPPLNEPCPTSLRWEAFSFHCSEQLAIYARWWQRIILFGVILCRTQPTTGVI
jgi:hypothetical protein